MTQLPAKYIVKSEAPRGGLVPLQRRNWPLWVCPHCYAPNHLEIDVITAITRLVCSSCETVWNVEIIFMAATDKPKRRRSEDDIPTDCTDGNCCSECGNPLEDDGECLTCDRNSTKKYA